MRIPLSNRLAVIVSLLFAAPATAAADAPRVVASIKPVHSLVAGVMDGVETPHLFVGGGDSPHTYAMRPSDARALAEADAVFWVGPEIETFLARAIDNLGHDVHSVALIEAPGLVLHDDIADEEGHHDHGHADDDGHAHEHGHAHDDQDEHDHFHEGRDAHIWLDPANAGAMVEAIVAALAETDPANAGTYEANGATLSDRLTGLESDIAARLAPYQDVPFFTLHEAFRYFAERFELNARGAITVSPEVQPGARRIADIRDEIGAHERVCVFAEPQFPPRLVDVIVEGTGAESGVVDPLGAELADGPELYFDLLKYNADAVASCLARTM